MVKLPENGRHASTLGTSCTRIQFDIVCRRGILNTNADALSRRHRSVENGLGLIQAYSISIQQCVALVGSITNTNKQTNKKRGHFYTMK